MNAITVTTGVPAPAHTELQRLRRAARTGMRIETAGTIALLLVAFAVPTLIVDRWLRLEWIYRALLLASFLYVVGRELQRRLLRPMAVALSDEEMALAVERSAPDVKQALISSLQFDRELHDGAAHVESPAMKAAVVADVRRRLDAIPFARAIDARRVRRFGLALAGAAAFFAAWAGIDAHSLGLWAARNLALANVEWPRHTSLHLADGSPAAFRLAQGDALTVLVAVRGPVPDQVTVDYAFQGGERGTETMSRTGDRELTWTIESVLTDATLVVRGGDALPLELAVTVVERPRIDDLTVTVTYPGYMEREPEVVPPTEGEIRLPKGASLAVAGRSQKPLGEAFVLFADEHKTPLTLAADRLSFAGDFAPTASGLLLVDVVDQDRFGAGMPPKLLLRVGDDQPPSLEFRLRGIGSSITAAARIPGELRVKDDFGLRTVSASFRAIEDVPPEKGAAPLPEVPFAPATAVFGDALLRSARRYETTAQVDLLQWNQQLQDENAASNPIRPGMLFSLRFHATDNFGPGDPHEGVGETMVFRVVTRERLAEELRRRQVEQRGELERIRDDEQRALLELTELVNPAEAGERRRQAEARLKTLARQQLALGRRADFVAETYQRLILEYENNRLWEPNNARQKEAQIPTPLRQLAKESFPATARQIEHFGVTAAEPTRAEAVAGCKELLRRIDAILKAMEEAETLAALIEDLRVVIDLEKQAIRQVQQTVQKREEELFRPKDGESSPPSPTPPDKKDNRVPR